MFNINEIVCFESFIEDKNLLIKNKQLFYKPEIGVIVDYFKVPASKITMYSILSNNVIFKVPNDLVKKVE